MNLLDVILWTWRHGGKAVAGWSATTLADTLEWHRRKGTLLVVEDAGAPVGVLCWSRVGGEPAPWMPDDPGSKRIYIALVVGSLRIMWERLKATLPDWRECQFLAHRRGRTVTYPKTFAAKLEREPLRLTYVQA